jgi:hybrid cluster-associated redox disulfide protein
MTIEVIALVVAVVALLTAYLTMRRTGALDQRLTGASNDLAQLRAELNETRGKLEGKLADFRLELRRQIGELKFTPSMTIAEALQLHPQVGEVLANFNLGSCPSCAVSDVDTIQGACQTYGIDLAALMNALSRLIEPGDGGSVGPIDIQKMRVKVGL